MKKLKVILILLVILTISLGPTLLYAAGKHQESGQGRKIWDIVWRFINFFILVFVIVKYGRKPLMGFINQHSAEAKETLDHHNALLAETEKEYQATLERLSHIENLIEEVKEYMRQDAERAQKRILEDAQQTAALMLTDAKEHAGNMLQNAQQQVKRELVEMAVREAEKRIRQQIQPEDQEKLIRDYVANLAAAAQA